MFRINSLSYSYPGQSAALADIDARIPAGVVLLAGPNAGGKTTLLRILAGLIDPDRGEVFSLEHDRPLGSGDLRRATRMVMQEPEPQILGVRVGEDIMLGKSASSLGDGFVPEAERLADRLGLRRCWDESVDTLSHGQKRKLCLLHALAAGPKALALDEPFAGLDYPSACELRSFIKEHKAHGLTQIISVHDLEPVFDIADWLIVLADGKIAAEGEPAGLADRLAGWGVRPPGGGWDKT
ncbi:MAG: energy-coupling factor ABC transporter ATP-binding protein [Planctomycetes bacterium]|nr:energy-coupling factor ABC transporter ATP-binding protein [Planctomycetota bacterium]